MRPEKCKPFRVQAKILERRVFEEIEKLLRESKLSQAIFRKLDAHQANRDGWLREEGLNERKAALEAKTKSLLARLAELPEGIPAKVIFDEVERLQSEKKLVEESLAGLKSQTPGQATVKPLDYERFLVRLLRMVDSDPSVAVRKAVVTALIHRVGIREKGFRLAY